MNGKLRKFSPSALDTGCGSALRDDIFVLVILGEETVWAPEGVQLQWRR